jgi:hypothetical protein
MDGGTMKKLLAIVLLAGLVAACVTKPVYQVSNRPMPYGAENLTIDQVQRAIVAGVQNRGWLVEPLALGRIRATQQQEKLSAVVEIVFDKQRFSIVPVSSSGFREGDGTAIHPRYNLWIRNLERDINSAVNTAAFAKANQS